MKGHEQLNSVHNGKVYRRLTQQKYSRFELMKYNWLVKLLTY
jgi:hypothetical protein